MKILFITVSNLGRGLFEHNAIKGKILLESSTSLIQDDYNFKKWSFDLQGSTSLKDIVLET